MSHHRVHKIVLAVDARRFGALADLSKPSARDVVYGVTERALTHAGLRSELFYLEDRGDGFLATADPSVPPVSLVGTWLDCLYEELREVNRERKHPVQLRVALHGGLVQNDGRGLVGEAVDLTCRLCDSEVAKRTLEAAHPAPVLLVVSDYLYHLVVVPGGRYVEPEHYRSARVIEKEKDVVAWFHVPRMAVPPLPPPAGAPAGPEEPPSPDRVEARHAEPASRVGTERSADDDRGDPAERRPDEQRSTEWGRRPTPVRHLYSGSGPVQVFDGSTIAGPVSFDNRRSNRDGSDG